MTEIIPPPPPLIARKISESEFEKQLSAAEASIDRIAQTFHLRAEDALLEAKGLLTEAEKSAEHRVQTLKAAFTIIHDLKGQAGGFGYPLLGRIAAPLADFLRNPHAIASALHFRVINVHLDAALFVAEKQIKGDGGRDGEKLIERLAVAAKALG